MISPERLEHLDAKKKEGVNERIYTLRDISVAMTRAREELLGIKSDEPYRDIVGDIDIHSRVVSAQKAIFIERRGEWNRRVAIKAQGLYVLGYDHNDTVHIFDKLRPRRVGVKKRYQAIGITEGVLRRTEEILFQTVTTTDFSKTPETTRSRWKRKTKNELTEFDSGVEELYRQDLLYRQIAEQLNTTIALVGSSVRRLMSKTPELRRIRLSEKVNHLRGLAARSG